MKRCLFSLTALSTLLLSSCATLQSPSQETAMVASKASYVTAADLAKIQPKVIKEYIPIALPGQLVSVANAETHAPVKHFKSKEAAIKYANKQAMVTPKAGDFFNAMMTYHYMPGQLYVVYAAPMNITDIAFEPGEKIISQSAGDTMRWQIAKTYSGGEQGTQYHLLVKPYSPNLTNSLVITTNKRVYNIILKSVDNTADQNSDALNYMVSVHWNYPESMVQFDNDAPPADASSANKSHNGSNLNVANLHFNYAFGLVKGTRPDWMPSRVFSNNRQTFIQFGPNFNSSNLPVLFVANNNGKYESMVNSRLKGNTMIIDEVIHKARLQTGVKSKGETIVQINQSA